MPKEELLEKIGLTKNESVVYLTLLQLGTSKTGEILKKSGLNSGKIYEILEALKVKGLVSESVINNVKHFTAAPPAQLLDYLEKRKEELEADEHKVKTLLPDLEKLRTISKKEVQAVVYTGLRGLKTAVDEAFEGVTPDQDMLGMGITAKKDPRYNKFWEVWSKKRVAKKVLGRHIFSERSDYYEAFKKLAYTEARVLTAITPVAVDIFGEDRILILNYTEPGSWILIYDKNTATSFRQFFEQLWKIAKK